MPVSNIQIWADHLEDTRLPGIDSSILALQATDATLTTSIASLDTALNYDIDVIRVAAAGADFDAGLAQSTANSATTLAAENLIAARNYADQQVALLRAELLGTVSSVQDGLNATIDTAVVQGVNARITDVNGANAATLASVQALKGAMDSHMTAFDSATGTLFGTELPGLQNDLTQAQFDIENQGSQFGIFLTGYEEPTLKAGLDYTLANANTANLGLNHTFLRPPASYWTTEPDSATYQPKTPVPSAWFLDNDTRFGDCLELPLGGQTAISQSYPLEYSQSRVYRVRARVRVTQDGTGGTGVHMSLGCALWDGPVAVDLSSEKRVTAAPIQIADGVQDISALMTGNLTKLNELGMTSGSAAADDALLLPNSFASKAFFYVRQNHTGVTDGRVRIDALIIEDVTEAIEAGQSASADKTAAEDARDAAQGALADARKAALRSFPSTFEEDDQYFTAYTSLSSAPDRISFYDVVEGRVARNNNPNYWGSIARAKMSPSAENKVWKVRALVRHVSGTPGNVSLRLEHWNGLDTGSMQSFLFENHAVSSTEFVWIESDFTAQDFPGVRPAALLNQPVTTNCVQECLALEMLDYSSYDAAAEATVVAVQAKNDANGFAGAAESAQGFAASYRDAAEGYSLAALQHSYVAARSARQGMAANPHFSDWDVAQDFPADFLCVEGNGTIIRNEIDAKYGHCAVITPQVGGSENFPDISLRSDLYNNFSVNPDDAETVLLTVEAELVSGDWDGAQVLVFWRASSGSVSTAVPLEDFFLTKVGEVQLLETYLERPAGYTTGTPLRMEARLFANGARGEYVDKTFRLHAFDLQPVVTHSLAGITKSVQTQQDGWASSLLALSATAGNANGSIRVFAFDDLETALSNIEFSSDFYTFVGGIAMFENAELQSLDYSPDTAGWKIDEAGNAEFNSLVSRSWMTTGSVSDRNHVFVAAEQTVLVGNAAAETGVYPCDPDTLWLVTVACEIRISTGVLWTQVSIAKDEDADGDWEIVVHDGQMNAHFGKNESATWTRYRGFAIIQSSTASTIKFGIRVDVENNGVPTQTNVKNAKIVMTGIRV